MARNAPSEMTGKIPASRQCWSMLGPVVERRHDGAVAVGFEPVAVDVADLRADLAEDRPGDQLVLLVVADLDGDVVPAERKVVERLAIHVHDEAVAGRGRPVPRRRPGACRRRRSRRGPAGRTARRRRRRGCGDGALDFDAVGHASMVSGRPPHRRRLPGLPASLRSVVSESVPVVLVLQLRDRLGGALLHHQRDDRPRSPRRRPDRSRRTGTATSRRPGRGSRRRRWCRRPRRAPPDALAAKKCG